MPTLAALVPGATSGLISEVLVADAGSQDDTAAVADIAGCDFLKLAGPSGPRLKTAAAAARAPWLLFLRPGIVLDGPWITEVERFLQYPTRDLQAAVFRRGSPSPSALREVLLLVRAALGAPPRPEQGLLIAKDFYNAVGGHSERATDAENELLRRIGRHRCASLSTGAFAPGGA